MRNHLRTVIVGILFSLLLSPVMALNLPGNLLLKGISLQNIYPNDPQYPQYPQYPTPPTPPAQTDMPIPPSYPGVPVYPGSNDFESADQLYNSGRQYYYQANYYSAAETLRRFLDRYPYEYRAAEACYLAAEAYMRLSLFGDALTYFRRVSAQYSYYSGAENATYYLAYCMVKLYDYSGATNEFRNFIIRYPYSQLADDAWYVSGLAYERLGNIAAAISAYQKVVNEFGGSNYYNESRQRLTALQGSTTNPQYPFPTNPNYPGVPTTPGNQNFLSDYELYNRGHSQFASGNMNNAVTYFNELLKRYPSSQYADDASFWKAKVRWEQKSHLQSISLFEALLRSYPGSQYEAEAVYTLAQVEKDYGRIQVANQTYLNLAANHFVWLQHTYPRHDSAAEALFQAGECYEIFGDYSSAKSYYQQAINIYPYSAAANKAREKLSGRY